MKKQWKRLFNWKAIAKSLFFDGSFTKHFMQLGAVSWQKFCAVRSLLWSSASWHTSLQLCHRLNLLPIFLTYLLTYLSLLLNFPCRVASVSQLTGRLVMKISTLASKGQLWGTTRFVPVTVSTVNWLLEMRFASKSVDLAKGIAKAFSKWTSLQASKFVAIGGSELTSAT